MQSIKLYNWELGNIYSITFTIQEKKGAKGLKLDLNSETSKVKVSNSKY